MCRNQYGQTTQLGKTKKRAFPAVSSDAVAMLRLVFLTGLTGHASFLLIVHARANPKVGCAPFPPFFLSGPPLF
jgi:hypothetical protein